MHKILLVSPNPWTHPVPRIGMQIYFYFKKKNYFIGWHKSSYGDVVSLSLTYHAAATETKNAVEYTEFYLQTYFFGGGGGG